MKKFISIFVAALFLSPVAAFASVCVGNIGADTSNENVGYPYGSNISGRWIAAQFTPGATCNLTQVGIRISTQGSPSDDVSVAVYDDSGGSPGSPVAAGADIPNGSITGSPQTIFSAFSSGTLSAATPYWIVVKRVGAGNTNDYFIWWWQDLLGTSNYNDSGPWAPFLAGQNYNFEVDGTTGPPPPPPPPSSTTLAAAVANATSSFQQTFGFSMDGVSNWMWDNLGQPILGSGLGTIVVLRWQILSLIAMSIIIFFCFTYFRFFKQ